MPPLLVVLFAFTALLPVFFFALFHNKGPLVFPQKLRWLSLAAAIVYSVAMGTQYHDVARQMQDLANVLNALANFTVILLLIAFFRQAGDDSAPDPPVSRLLQVTTNMAVAAWGFWMALCLVRLLAVPFVYFQVRKQAGVGPPVLVALFNGALGMLLSQASLFILPYVVYKSRPRVSGIIDKKNGH